jgi:hypothetical protein
MSTRDDLTRAADEARAQVTAARDALAASRDARTGGSAKNLRQAEQQLESLRTAVADDVRALRDRLVALDPSARRGATVAAVAGAGALATLVGTGLAVRGRVRRGVAERGVQKQALAIARALVGQQLDVAGATALGASGGASGGAPGRRRGRGGRAALLGVLAVGAAVAGAAIVQQRRNAPVDDEDLWLPERDLGPA